MIAEVDDILWEIRILLDLAAAAAVMAVAAAAVAAAETFSDL